MENEERNNRFRILVCIDGEDEGYRCLQYATRMGGNRADCDIVLLHVRPIDQGLATGGLQLRLARENILNWGLDLPGIRYLKKGLSMLVEEKEMDILVKAWIKKYFSLNNGKDYFQNVDSY